MISDNIDLTENRDFRTKSVAIINFDTGLITAFVNEDKFEKFFGKKYHYTETLAVFENTESYEQEMREHCQRCGKLLRIPWKVKHELCETCDEDTDTEFSDKNKIQWFSNKNFVINRLGNDDDRDILSMR